MSEESRPTIENYLALWQAFGVDGDTSDAPADWARVDRTIVASPGVAEAAVVSPAHAPALTPSGPLAPGPAPHAMAAPAPGLTRKNSPPVTLDAAMLAAIASARDLAAVLALLQGFEGCGLKATAKNLCFYRGAPQARLMLIGEAPGRDEDLEGKPFVGRAGQLLDRMLAAIGIDETRVHIANTVYWRPPGNRTPTAEETQACAPFLQRQMELVAPDIVLLLGGVATKSVLGLNEGILKLRGKWRELTIAGRTVCTLASLHPAYLLRTPAAKRQSWQDLQLIQAALTPEKL